MTGSLLDGLAFDPIMNPSPVSTVRCDVMAGADHSLSFVIRISVSLILITPGFGFAPRPRVM